jgi:excisionase family DNA binding protein
MNNKTPKRKKMFTVAEAAEQLGVSPSTIRTWIKREKFPGTERRQTEIGSFYLIPVSVVAKFKRGTSGRPKGAKNKPKKLS